MLTLTVPNGRGKESRSAKPWAKTVVFVAKNANSGREWDGEWLTQGNEAEVELGDLIVVSDKDGEGAVLYVAASIVRWGTREGKAISQAEFWTIDSDGGKRWASAMSVEARKWLSMSVDERLEKVNESRLAQLKENREAKVVAAITDGRAEYKFGKETITPQEALSRFDAMITLAESKNTPAATQSPREQAIANVKAMMAEHGITIADLS